MAYKTPIGMSPYLLVYRKVCHLLVEFEENAFWPHKLCNLDSKFVGEVKALQPNEPIKFRIMPMKVQVSIMSELNISMMLG